MLTRKYVYSSLCFVIFLFLFVAASGPDSLAVKSNVVTHVRSRDAAVNSGSGRRWRRSMSQREMDESTSIHNNLRRREGASDMEYMKWNSYLASMAQDWADGCNFVHGQPNRDPSTRPYDPIGQNLHATTGQLNITSALVGWYNEKQFYDYNSNNCEPNEMCGHYTQVVWASSREIGCAVSRCPILRSTSFGKNPASYLVCNYGPAGNYGGQKPYKNGKACSRCRNGVSWCNEGLCNSYCKKSGPGCTCAATCLNCGTINQATCSCSCAAGWHGIDCSTKCADTDIRCNNGWPPYWCNHATYGAIIRQNCPLMCTLCRVANETEPLTCASPPSLPHSNQAKSLSFIIAVMTLATMTSLIMRTMDLLR